MASAFSVPGLPLPAWPGRTLPMPPAMHQAARQSAAQYTAVTKCSHLDLERVGLGGGAALSLESLQCGVARRDTRHCSPHRRSRCPVLQLCVIDPLQHALPSHGLRGSGKGRSLGMKGSSRGSWTDGCGWCIKL